MGPGAALAGFCRRPGVTIAIATLLVALPMIVALVDLHGQRWYPVLDLAMTEFRVRDVGGAHPPLIGLPGRIGEYPDQGSHPGPLSFYLLAPTYRLLGSSAWALQAATVVIHVAAIATALWIGHRRGGWRGVVGVAAVLALVIRGYGQLLLTQPWNPYLPLLAWIVVLLATWSVLCGDSAMLVLLVVAASLCAQTHVPYLLSGAVLTLGALGLTTRRWWRARTTSGADAGRHALVAAVLGVALWVPPLIDQITNDPGNVRRLLDHFGSPPEPVLGLADGLRLALRHLDVWAGFTGFTGDLEGAGRFVSPAVTWRGGVMLAVWIAAAVLAWRTGPSALRRLHLTIAAALVLGLISTIRIFGLPWYYLTLWAWGTTTLAVAAVAWTAVVLWRRTEPRSRAHQHAGPASATAAVAVAATLAATVAFAGAEVPERRLSDAVAALAGPTYAAVVDGAGDAPGPDGAYLVRWSDAADIGSPGFGLLNELERRGLDVAADEFFHVPVTDHRVRPRTADETQIHLATGGYVDVWRAVPDAVEVATYDPRTPDEAARYRETRARLVVRLDREGLGDVAALVDTNLFGASLDPRISAADLADITALLDLGQPMAVFIAPALVEPR